jgi:hypothetical protein
VKPVAVFDTNVFFSAAAWRGKPADCVSLAQNGVVEGVTCTEILNELAEKLRLRLGFSNEQTLRIFGSMLGILRPVTITGGFRMRGRSEGHAHYHGGQEASFGPQAVSGNRYCFAG